MNAFSRAMKPAARLRQALGERAARFLLRQLPPRFFLRAALRVEARLLLGARQRFRLLPRRRFRLPAALSLASSVLRCS